MIRCPTCNDWTPGINGMCSDCYEKALLPHIDAETRCAIALVREQEERLDELALIDAKRTAEAGGETTE